MDELLELVQEKAGISADQAQKAIDTVMEFMQDKLPAPVVSQIEKFMGGGDGDGDEGGDTLGGITDKLGGLMGGGD